MALPVAANSGPRTRANQGVRNAWQYGPPDAHHCRAGTIRFADAVVWQVNIDPDGLQNALPNLAPNAGDAMDGHSKLIVETLNVKTLVNDPDEKPDKGMPPGRCVMISGSEKGSGMLRKIADRAF